MKNKHYAPKAAVFVAAALIFLLTGCGGFAASKGPKTNKRYNEKKMQTLTGKKVSVKKQKDVYADQEFGFGFVVPKTLNDLREKGTLEILPGAENITFFTVFAQSFFPLRASIHPETITEDEWIAFVLEAEKHAFAAGFMLRVPSGELSGDDEALFEYVKERYAVCEKIAEAGGISYWFGYNTDYSNVNFSDAEKADVQSVIDELKDFKKNIFVFPPLARGNAVSQDGSVQGGLTSFSARTLDGKTVTQDLFKDYKVTMINIWATWCSPCVKEMPDLAKLHSSMLPSGTNMISICVDAAENPEGAKQVLASVSAGFTTLVPNADLAPFLNGVSALPTTVFVDSKGNFIGKAITGAPGREPAAAYAKTLQELSDAENAK